MLKAAHAARLAYAATCVSSRPLAVVAYHPPKTTAVLKPRGGAPLTDDIQKQEVAALLARVNLSISKPELIYEALTHRSHNAAFNNGRLSVLGSAIVNSTIISHIYTHYPNLSEFSLRQLSRHLQSFANLQTMAKSIGLDAAVLSKLKDDGRVDIVIANALQAFIGAVAVDKGTKAAQALCFDLVVPTLQGLDITEFLHLSHPHFTLQRILEAQGRAPFTCRIISESGRKTHLPTFVVGVYSGEELLAQGAGFSIRNAETELLSVDSCAGCDISLQAIQNALKHHFAEALKTLTPPQDGDHLQEYETEAPASA